MPARHATGGRTAILAAARALFAEHGTYAISVDRVATHAGLTKHAVYYHFPDKAALVSAYLEDVTPRSLSIFTRLAGDGPPGVDRIRTMFANLDRLLDHPTYHGCVMLKASHSGVEGRAAAAQHRQALQTWFQQDLQASHWTKEAAATGARALVLILDGALAESLFMPTREVVEAAVALAELSLCQSSTS